MRSIFRKDPDRSDGSPAKREEGLAVLVAVVALSIISLLGMYVSLNATTEIRIADNLESKLQAEYAAIAGINHARELLKGLRHNDLLKGPDGAYSNSSGYYSSARTLTFRNPLTWNVARSINLLDPASAVSGLPDDGVINTGIYNGTPGTILIPLTGIALTSPNPYGSGNITTSRYFVKISDNSGDVSEKTADPPDNPFVDGDGIVVVRSMGVAGTIRATADGVVRANSVSEYEIRFLESRTFSFADPLVLQGNTVVPSAPNMFDGNSFKVDGGSYYGIGTIDTDLTSGTPVYDQVSGQLSKTQKDNINGKGGNPSVNDITTTLTGDGVNLLNAGWLWSFVQYQVPTFADNVFYGDQSWSGNSAHPDLGHYDPTLPVTDPAQIKKVTYVNGDLSLSGNMEGCGLLVVTGKLGGSGSLSFGGLVLVIGKGDVNFTGMNISMTGGLYVVNVQPDANGVPQFGTTKFTMAGKSNFVSTFDSVELATSQIPPQQLSFREVKSSMDP